MKHKSLMVPVPIIIFAHLIYTMIIETLWCEADTAAQAAVWWQWIKWPYIPTSFLFIRGDFLLPKILGLLHCLAVFKGIIYIRTGRWRPLFNKSDQYASGKERCRNERIKKECELLESGQDTQETGKAGQDEAEQPVSCSGRFFLFVIGLFCFCVFALLVWQKAWIIDRWMSQQALEWKPVDAVIIQSTIRGDAGDVGPYYQMTLHCEYSVDGKRHTKRLRRFKMAKARRQLERLQRKGLDVGDTIRLYYNPMRPYESTAEYGKSSCFFTTIMIISGILGIFLICAALAGTSNGRIQNK